jgi:hypothetical protein
MAIMAITTRSSINVKPLRLPMIVLLAYPLAGEDKQAQPNPPGGDCQGTWINVFPDTPRVFPLLRACLSELLYS